jgi:hypothetical protein
MLSIYIYIWGDHMVLDCLDGIPGNRKLKQAIGACTAALPISITPGHFFADSIRVKRGYRWFRIDCEVNIVVGLKGVSRTTRLGSVGS